MRSFVADPINQIQGRRIYQLKGIAGQGEGCKTEADSDFFLAEVQLHNLFENNEVKLQYTPGKYPVNYLLLFF